jgi:hypothetical protein
MPKKNSPPSYRLHKARNCAVVTIAGRNHYLGLILALLRYWFSPAVGRNSRISSRARIKKDGLYWAALPHADLEFQTGLPEYQVKRSVRTLRRRRLIERHGNSHLLRTNPQEPGNGDTRGVRVYSGLVRMAGKAAQGIILAQLNFWFDDGEAGYTRASVHRDDHCSVAKS